MRLRGYVKGWSPGDDGEDGVKEYYCFEPHNGDFFLKSGALCRKKPSPAISQSIQEIRPAIPHLRDFTVALALNPVVPLALPPLLIFPS
jgi:hypothetical protein